MCGQMAQSPRPKLRTRQRITGVRLQHVCANSTVLAGHLTVLKHSTTKQRSCMQSYTCRCCNCLLLRLQTHSMFRYPSKPKNKTSALELVGRAVQTGANVRQCGLLPSPGYERRKHDLPHQAESSALPLIVWTPAKKKGVMAANNVVYIEKNFHCPPCCITINFRPLSQPSKRTRPLHLL